MGYMSFQSRLHVISKLVQSWTWWLDLEVWEIYLRQIMVGLNSGSKNFAPREAWLALWTLQDKQQSCVELGICPGFSKEKWWSTNYLHTNSLASCLFLGPFLCSVQIPHDPVENDPYFLYQEIKTPESCFIWSSVPKRASWSWASSADAVPLGKTKHGKRALGPSIPSHSYLELIHYDYGS